MANTRSRSVRAPSWADELWEGADVDELPLPEEMRTLLKDPWGDVFSENELAGLVAADDLVVTVGDMCTLTLHRKGFAPRISVVDFKTKREGLSGSVDEIRRVGDRTVSVRNPAGVVTRDLWEAVRDAFRGEGSVRIEVDGEEDLAFLPCVVFAPEHAKIIYGQPDVGLVLVRPNSEMKVTVKEIIEKMKGA